MTELIEKVADFMHDQWSHWMKYLYSKLTVSDEINWKSLGDRTMNDMYASRRTIDQFDHEHWKRQMETPYAELSEKEKDSDREWAMKLIKLLSEEGVDDASDLDISDYSN